MFVLGWVLGAAWSGIRVMGTHWRMSVPWVITMCIIGVYWDVAWAVFCRIRALGRPAFLTGMICLLVWFVWGHILRQVRASWTWWTASGHKFCDSTLGKQLALFWKGSEHPTTGIERLVNKPDLAKIESFYLHHT